MSPRLVWADGSARITRRPLERGRRRIVVWATPGNGPFHPAARPICKCRCAGSATAEESGVRLGVGQRAVEGGASARLDAGLERSKRRDQFIGAAHQALRTAVVGPRRAGAGTVL